MSGGKPERFPDITQKHIGSLDLGRLDGQFFIFERRRNGFFHQALTQPDAEITADDLDDVFGFERRG
ncbi:MAG TPA: hypothetical protein VFR08_10190, partial [Candidatus Angelobacter sp.]|nr:hypothetical protein [Candidatus Angelobacter sp.]